MNRSLARDVKRCTRRITTDLWARVMIPVFGQAASRWVAILFAAWIGDEIGIEVPLISALIDWIEADTALRRSAILR